MESPGQRKEKYGWRIKQCLVASLYLMNAISQKHERVGECTFEWEFPWALTQLEDSCWDLRTFTINSESRSRNAGSDFLELSHWHAASFHYLQERRTCHGRKVKFLVGFAIPYCSKRRADMGRT